MGLSLEAHFDAIRASGGSYITTLCLFNPHLRIPDPELYYTKKSVMSNAE